MTQFRLHTLTRAELLDEVALLGHQMDASELDALMALGVLPFVETEKGDRFPLVALVQTLDALDASAPLVMDELKERCQIFLDAMDGVANGLTSAHRELRQLLNERAVLGELHRMLPVMESGALETLRGDARLEWRLRMSLAEIGRLLATDRFRDEATTPLQAESTTTAGRRKSPMRKPRMTTRSGAAVIPGLLPKTEASANRRAVDARLEAAARPPAPGVGPYQVDDEDKSPIETGVRMPFLSDHDFESDASIPVRPSPPVDIDDDGHEDTDHEDTEPFVSELSASRIETFAEYIEQAGDTSPEIDRLGDAHRRARRRWANDDPPTLQLETPCLSQISPAEDWDDGPTTASDTDPTHRPGLGALADSEPPRASRVSTTDEFPTVGKRPEPRFPQRTRDIDALKLSPAARARQEAIALSRDDSDGESQPPASRDERFRNWRAGDTDGGEWIDRVDARLSDRGSTNPDEPAPEPDRAEANERDAGAAHATSRPRYEAPERETDRAMPGRGGEPARDSADDSVSSFLEQGFSAPPVPRGGERSAEQTDLHMATSEGRDPRSDRLSTHTDLLVETAGLWSASSALDSRVELPVWRSSEGRAVDIQAVPNDPHAAFERSAARLEKNGDDTQAQDELLAIVGGNDRKLARKAWATVAPYLRERRGRSDALFGGLVMMSARDPEPAARVRHLREAAGVAESVLGDHKQAFELITDAIALVPSEDLLTDRAETLAEAFGWWPDYVARLVEASRDAGDADLRVQLTLLAGAAAREKVKDNQLAIDVYEGLISGGVYDDDVVAALIDVHAREGRSDDTLVLLLRCAEIADGVERVERLSRAADLCVEELNDLDRALEIYEAALEKDAQSDEIRRRYISLSRRSGQNARATRFLGSRESDPYASAMVRAQVARNDFEDVELEIAALHDAFSVSGGGEKLRAGFALADAQRKDDRHAGEVRTLENMLADVGPGDDRVAVVRRLAGVLAAQDGGKEDAIEHYTESIRAGEFDEKLVHALISLLRADDRVDDVIDTLVLAAQNSKADGERVSYFRQVAKTALDSIADDEQALGLIEQMVDASGGDAEVLVFMAARSRKAGDDLSEMAALEQAIHDDAISVDPAVLMRLAELELARPRGAARAAELVERVLDLAPLASDVEGVVTRVMPAVVDGTGRRDLDLRWTWSQAESADDEVEAFVLWSHVVALHETVGGEPEDRLHAVEAALAAAEDMNAPEKDRAGLQLSMARVKRLMGHWNVAVEHARAAATYFLRADPAGFQALEAVASVAELTQYVIDERPALKLLREAAATGEPPLMAAYAEALMHKGRWVEALPVLEELVQATTDPEMLERLENELQRARTEASA